MAPNSRHYSLLPDVRQVTTSLFYLLSEASSCFINSYFLQGNPFALSLIVEALCPSAASTQKSEISVHKFNAPFLISSQILLPFLVKRLQGAWLNLNFLRISELFVSTPRFVHESSTIDVSGLTKNSLIHIFRRPCFSCFLFWLWFRKMIPFHRTRTIWKKLALNASWTAEYSAVALHSPTGATNAGATKALFHA